MNRIAKAIAGYIARNGMINQEQMAMYEYGFLVMLEMSLSMIISFFIAYSLHMIIEGILFFLIFIPLRSYAGGLHLENYWGCLTLSCLTFTAVLITANIVHFSVFLTFILYAGLVLAVWILYPVDHMNRKVDKDEDKYFKKRLRSFLIFDIVIALLIIFFEKDTYLSLITMTLLMLVITMMIGKFKNNRMYRCDKGLIQEIELKHN